MDTLPQAQALLAELNGLQINSFEDAVKKFKIRFALIHDFGYSTNRQPDGTYMLVPIVENIDERYFHHEF